MANESPASGEAGSQQVVNTEASAVSTPADTQDVAVNTPPESNSGSEQRTVSQSVPYSRFKEVVDSRNQLESRLEELSNRIASHEDRMVQSQKVNAAAKYEKMLVDKGLDATVAKALTEANFGLVNDVLGERIAPLEQETAAQRVDQWVAKLAQVHTDWYELEPAMEKILNAMPKQLHKTFIASPEGLEMLYSKAKLSQVMASQQQTFTAGANAAYQNKGLKNAVSPTPGASIPKPAALDRETIMKMPADEFRKRYSEIVASRQSAE